MRRIRLSEKLKHKLLRPSSICERKCETVRTLTPGRPPFYVPAENLEDLCGICFSWKNIAQLFGISRWTHLSPSPVLWLASMQQFSVLSDAEIDEIVVEHLS